MGDLGSVPGLGKSPREGNGYPFSILTWRIPRTKERSPAGYSPWGRNESDMTERLTFSLFILSTVLILMNTIYTRKRCGQIFISIMNWFFFFFFLLEKSPKLTQIGCMGEGKKNLYLQNKLNFGDKLNVFCK